MNTFTRGIEPKKAMGTGETILTKLKEIKEYYESSRQTGHTTLMKKGIDNYDREKLVLVYKNEIGKNLELKQNEIISWHNLDKLKGQHKPLIIEDGAMWIILKETIEYIEKLENKNL